MAPRSYGATGAHPLIALPTALKRQDMHAALGTEIFRAKGGNQMVDTSASMPAKSPNTFIQS